MKHHPVPDAPRIDALPPGTARPLFSVMIPSYNYAEYMPATLRSVLAQDPGPAEMQIEVVDDCSTTHDPEPMVRAVGGGRIAFHRQPRNVGMIANFNSCIGRAQGEWIHILHGDDIVRPDFYARASRAIRAHPEIGAWVCRVIYMDESGLWRGFSELESHTPQVMGEHFVRQVLVDQRLQFAGTIVRRSVYERLGGFRPELILCLDWDMWKRIAVHAPIFYDPEPLACFRLHQASVYGQAVRAGKTVADERLSVQFADAYVPAAEAAGIRREALKITAIRAIRNARNQWKLGYRKTALRLLMEASRCSFHPAVLARMALVLASMAAETPTVHAASPATASPPQTPSPSSAA
jgi:glycosyltransferase involved in cell wall biosynthesis